MTITLLVKVKGGAGSGNWGHAGRPGLVGGSGGRGGHMLTVSDFGEGFTTYQLIESTSRSLAETWDVDANDLNELATEEGFDLSGERLEHAKQSFLEYELRKWAGSSGDAISEASMAHIADKLGLGYNLRDTTSLDFIRSHAGMDRATRALGDAIYSNTQEWLSRKGVDGLQLLRSGSAEGNRLMLSWSLDWGGVRHESGRPVISRYVPRRLIFSTPVTGFGTFTEAEVVTLPLGD